MIASRRPHYLVTANVDFLVQAQRDAELRVFSWKPTRLCAMECLWYGRRRWLANGLPEPRCRLAPTVCARLLELAADRNYRVFFWRKT